jgi:hypothetical protein
VPALADFAFHFHLPRFHSAAETFLDHAASDLEREHLERFLELPRPGHFEIDAIRH